MPKRNDEKPIGKRTPETAAKEQKTINEGHSKFSREPITTGDNSRPIVPAPRKNKSSGVK